MDDEARIRWACRLLVAAEERGLDPARAWAGCRVGVPPSKLLALMAERGLVVTETRVRGSVGYSGISTEVAAFAGLTAAGRAAGDISDIVY